MDCEKLGFTTSDKTSWCGKLIKCKGNPQMTLCQNLCEVGDVFYADGTCGYAKDYEASLGKIPVGVVYFITDNGRHGKVINLRDLGIGSSGKFDPTNPYNGSTLFQWGVSGEDIAELENLDCSYLTTAKQEDRSIPFWSAGKKNTDIIAKAQGNNLMYAAPAARAFYPPKVKQDDPKVGAGRWYLPTLGELMDLYGYDFSNLGTVCNAIKNGAIGDTKEKVFAALKTLQSKGFDAKEMVDYYWTSSEYDKSSSWLQGVYGDRGVRAKSNQDGFKNNRVRVSLEF